MVKRIMGFLAQRNMGPARVLFMGWLPSLIVLPVIGATMWSLYSSYAIIARDDFLLQERIGTILRSNEALTMYCRLAASTGQSEWEAKYRQIEPGLDQSIVDVALLARTEYERTYAARTKMAYAKLIETENLAFALIRNGRAKEAKDLVFSHEYEKQKGLYSEGIIDLTRSIRSRVGSSVSLMRERIWSTGLMGFFSVLFLFVAWIGIWFVVRIQLEERKRAEEELRNRNDFLTTVFEAISHPLVVTSAHDQSVEKANSAAAARGLVGPKAGSKSGQEWRETGLAHPVADPVQQVKETKQHAIVERVEINDDGRTRTTEVHAYPIFDKDGGVSKILQYWLDVTDRKERERLQTQTARFMAVADLASGVAHNFNNLLQIILSGAELAMSNIDAGEGQKARMHLKHITQSARFGSGTVKRLQDLANLRHDRKTDRHEVFDASDTVAKAVEMCTPLWKTGPEKDGIEIAISEELQSGCFITGQEDEFFEVALNLFSNAVHALPSGGEIRVSTAKEDGHVLVRFRDNGVGISKGNLDKVFEPFWTTKGFRSSGMGLPSSLAIVKRYGGEIFVDSEEGKGSCFTVRLTIGSGPPHLPGTVTQERDLLDRLQILVIDDEELIADLLADGLTTLGHTVFTAFSGRQGIDVFKRNDVDVVICDLGMPGMNGWEVGKQIAEICRERSVPKTPFILCTGWGGQVRQDTKMAEAQVDGVTEKPVDLSQLTRMIGAALFQKK